MEDANLTLNDLANLRSLVDIACTRGAFKANEMKDVGDLYNKLDAFVKQMSAVQTQNTETVPSTESEKQSEE